MFKFTGRVESIEIATAHENWLKPGNVISRIIRAYANLGIHYSVILDPPVKGPSGLIDRVYVLNNLVARHHLRHGQVISGEAQSGKDYAKAMSILTRRIRAGSCIY